VPWLCPAEAHARQGKLAQVRSIRERKLALESLKSRLISRRSVVKRYAGVK